MYWEVVIVSGAHGAEFNCQTASLYVLPVGDPLSTEPKPSRWVEAT